MPCSGREGLVSGHPVLSLSLWGKHYERDQPQGQPHAGPRPGHTSIPGNDHPSSSAQHTHTGADVHTHTSRTWHTLPHIRTYAHA